MYRYMSCESCSQFDHFGATDTHTQHTAQPPTLTLSDAAHARTDDAPLPPGWEAFSSPRDGGSLYYHHAESSETRWERPSSDADLAAVPASASTLSGGAPGGAPGGASGSAPSGVAHRPQSTRLVVQAVSLSPAVLPPGWVAHTSAADGGKTYYHNAASGTTAWEHPTALHGASRGAEGAAEAQGGDELAAAPPPITPHSCCTALNEVGLVPASLRR